MATDTKIVQKSGSWFNYGETKLGQGRDRARQSLEENPEMFQEILGRVREAKGFGATNGEAVVDSADE